MAGAQLKIVISAKDLATGPLNKVGSSLKNLGGGINSLGNKLSVGTALIAAPLLAGAAAAIKLGMDAQETRNLFTVAMGDMAQAGQSWVDSMNRSLGLNRTELQRSLGVYQSMLTSMGLAAEESFDMSKGLTALAHDFASFYNLRPEEAFDKIRAGIMGETEPLKALGIVVSDATMKQWALKNGLMKTGDEMSEQQKVLARYNLIMEQSANAQGDLARTMDSPTNQLRLMRERFTEIATTVGEEFLPTVGQALTWINNEGLPRVTAGTAALKEGWINMSDTAKGRVLAVTTLLIAGGPLLKGIGVAITGVGKLAMAFNFLAVAAKTKVGMVAAALTVVGAGVLLTYNQVADIMRKFGDTITNVGAGLSSSGVIGITQIGDALQKTGRSMATASVGVKQYWDGVSTSAVDAASEIDDKALKVFDDLVETTTKLGGDVLTDAGRAFDEFAGYTSKARKGMGDMRVEAEATGDKLAGPAKISKPEWDKYANTLGDTAKKAKEADVSVRDLTSALIAIHPATRAAAQAVTYWDGEIASVNLALDANRDQLQAAQAELGRMQDRLSDLSGELTTAKQRLDDFARPRLTGMGELETQINAVQDALKRMDLADATGADFSDILSQYPLLAQGAAAYLATLPQTREGLDAQLRTLQALQAVKYDEKLRLLGAAAEDSRLEMPYEQAMAGVVAYKARVSDLTGAIASQEAAIRGQEGVVKSLNAAQDALNRTLQGYQEQLTLAKANQDAVVSGLQQAFQWILADREEIQKLGPAGVAAAAQVDAKTIEILTGLSEFAETNTTTNQLQVNAMQTAYESAVEQIKAQLASIPKEFEVKVKVTTEQIASAAGSTGIPQFASGGTVPGPIGSPTLAVVHGGEYVVPVGGGSRSAGSVAAPTIVHVHVHVAGSVVTERQLVDVIDAGLRQKARDNGRAY